ncbi:MAG: helix-turn-helix transcriptional regulator [Deltaproteobacteria bacterium]|nr:helix-turn-helix transcriptional regulator [Deltaproteobacteria bacterium]
MTNETKDLPLQDGGVAGRVRKLMQENLSANHVLEDVAGRLSLSPRQLQRLLAAEGTSFKKILKDERTVFAQMHLSRNTELSVIATSLGYSCVTCLYRAFRRWTSITPGEYRRQTSDGE